MLDLGINFADSISNQIEAINQYAICTANLEVKEKCILLLDEIINSYYYNDAIIKAAKTVKNKLLDEYYSLFDGLRDAVSSTSSYVINTAVITALVAKFGTEGSIFAVAVDVADAFLIHSTEFTKATLKVYTAEYLFQAFEKQHKKILNSSSYVLNENYLIIESNLDNFKTSYIDLVNMHIIGEKTYLPYLQVYKKMIFHDYSYDFDAAEKHLRANIEYCNGLLEKYSR